MCQISRKGREAIVDSKLPVIAFTNCHGTLEMWKRTSAIFLVLLIASNGWWLYQAIDLAVTEKYRQQEEYEADQTIEALKAVTSQLVRGHSKQQLVDVLARALPQEEPFEKEGAIHVVFLSFPISDDDVIEGVQ